MTRIDADTILPAPPEAVWRLLAETERWPEWYRAGDGSARLEQADLLREPPDVTGAVRSCQATVTVWPFAQERVLRWTEHLIDAMHPWWLEFEVVQGIEALRRLRVRLTLVEQPDGQTRVRWRMTYTPATLPMRFADLLFLRRALARWGAGALDHLAGMFRVAEAAATPEVPIAGGARPKEGEAGAIAA